MSTSTLSFRVTRANATTGRPEAFECMQCNRDWEVTPATEDEVLADLRSHACDPADTVQCFVQPSRRRYDDDADVRSSYLERVTTRPLAKGSPTIEVLLDGQRCGLVGPRVTVMTGGGMSSRYRVRVWGYSTHGDPVSGGSGAIASRKIAIDACAVHAIEGAQRAGYFLSDHERGRRRRSR